MCLDGLKRAAAEQAKQHNQQAVAHL